MTDQLDIYNSFFSFLLDNLEIQSNSQPLFSQTEKKKKLANITGLARSANQRVRYGSSSRATLGSCIKVCTISY